MQCSEHALKSCAESSPRSAKHPAPTGRYHPGVTSPMEDSTAVARPRGGWGPFVAQLLLMPGSCKEHRCVTAPARAPQAAEGEPEGEPAFLHGPRPCGKSLPATLPGNRPCWGRWSYTHSSSLGSPGDDQTYLSYRLNWQSRSFLILVQWPSLYDFIPTTWL